MHRGNSTLDNRHYDDCRPTVNAVPGLYERVFYDELGMRTADVVVGLFAQALRDLGREPAAERVLDLGAGNGIGATLLRELGVGTLVGLDLEPAARDAAQRDRPGVYDDFLVADLAAQPEILEDLCARGFTALVAVSAIGVGHIPLALLADTVRRVLSRGGLFAYAVADDLLPAFFTDFFTRVEAERLGERRYEHRRSVDGGDHPATAVAAVLL